jgi:hypothetical protein
VRDDTRPFYDVIGAAAGDLTWARHFLNTSVQKKTSEQSLRFCQQAPDKFDHWRAQSHCKAGREQAEEPSQVYDFMGRNVEFHGTMALDTAIAHTAASGSWVTPRWLVAKLMMTSTHKELKLFARSETISRGFFRGRERLTGPHPIAF